MKKIIASAAALIFTVSAAIAPVAEKFLLPDSVISAGAVSFEDFDNGENSLYENEISKIISKVNKSWSDYEKALFVHDYLALTVEYDTDMWHYFNPYNNCYNKYGPIIDKVAVCQGYAEAYVDIMTRLGVPCELVTSDQLNHAWNVVKIGGYWYHVDITWDDPLPDLTGRSDHFYFLKSNTYFQTKSDDGNGSHSASDYEFTGKYNLTESDIKGTKFDNQLNNVENAFGYYNGYWYGRDGRIIMKYKMSDNGASEAGTLKSLEDKWAVWNETDSWYIDDNEDVMNFSGISVVGNKLYYSTPTEITNINLDNGSETTTFTLDENQAFMGNIYGFYTDNENQKVMLYYELKQDPDSGYGVKLSKFLENIPDVKPDNTTDSDNIDNSEKTEEKKVDISTAKVTGVKTSYTYTGRQIKPSVKVTADGSVLKKGTDYTVSYGTNKIGKGTVTIKGKGSYTGTIKKSFKIIPRKTSVSCKSASKGKMTVSLAKKTEAGKYQIIYSTSKKFSSYSSVKTKSTKKTFNVKSKKVYYVKARTIKTVGGVDYISGWSAVKKVKIR